jgi:hypothetical protein
MEKQIVARNWGLMACFYRSHEQIAQSSPRERSRPWLDFPFYAIGMCAYCHILGKRVVGKQTQTFLEWRDRREMRL